MSRRRRKWATNLTRDPTRGGGSVSHSTDSMLRYHAGAFDGSAAYSATSSSGRSITVSDVTSTFTIAPFPSSARLHMDVDRAHRVKEQPVGGSARDVKDVTQVRPFRPLVSVGYRCVPLVTRRPDRPRRGRCT